MNKKDNAFNFYILMKVTEQWTKEREFQVVTDVTWAYKEGKQVELNHEGRSMLGRMTKDGVSDKRIFS